MHSESFEGLIVQPYYRVSRHDARRGITIEVQQSVCASFAQFRLRGATMLDPLIDRGISAYNEDWRKRQAFVDLLERAKRREFHVVLVYMLDRFSRKTAAGLRAIQLLDEADVRVMSAMEPIDYSNAFGRKQLRDSLSSAEFYSDMLAQRMRDVRRWEAEQGRIVGPLPRGYSRENGTVVLTPESEGVQLLGELYASGDYGYARCADALRACGWGWKTTAIEEMLKCPIYAGYVQAGDRLVKGKHPAIWSEELWQRIQGVREQRQRRRARIVESWPLLAGIGWCAGCGAKLWHQPHSQHRYYECSSYKTRGQGPVPGLVCTGAKLHAEVLERHLLAWVGALALTPDLLDLAYSLAPPRTAPQPLNKEAELRALQQRFLKREVNAFEFERLEQEILNRVNQVQTAETGVNEEALALMANMPALLAEATPEERRQIVRLFVAQVYARRDSILALRPTPEAQPLFQAVRLRGWLNSAEKWAACPPGPPTLERFPAQNGDRSDRRFLLPLRQHVANCVAKVHGRWRTPVAPCEADTEARIAPLLTTA